MGKNNNNNNGAIKRLIFWIILAFVFTPVIICIFVTRWIWGLLLLAHYFVAYVCFIQMTFNVGRITAASEQSQRQSEQSQEQLEEIYKKLEQLCDTLNVLQNTQNVQYNAPAAIPAGISAATPANAAAVPSMNVLKPFVEGEPVWECKNCGNINRGEDLCCRTCDQPQGNSTIKPYKKG